MHFNIFVHNINVFTTLLCTWAHMCMCCVYDHLLLLLLHCFHH